MFYILVKLQNVYFILHTRRCLVLVEILLKVFPGDFHVFTSIHRPSNMTSISIPEVKDTPQHHAAVVKFYHEDDGTGVVCCVYTKHFACGSKSSVLISSNQSTSSPYWLCLRSEKNRFVDYV